MAFPVPDNEQERLAALDRYRILDTPGESCFDRLTALASQLFEVPIAQLVFVDGTRAWAKSSRGLQIEQLPRELAFCAHAILSDELMLVADLQEDSRFFDNPLVVGPPYLRFYAGAPLRTPDGFGIGSLCVCDVAPRHHIDPQRLVALETIAAVAIDELEQRLAALEAPHRESQASNSWHRDAYEYSVCGLAIVDQAGICIEANPALCRISGYARHELLGQPATMILPPEARERASRACKAVLSGAVAPPAEILLQRKDGRRLPVVLVETRIPGRNAAFCLSTFLDVSELKHAEEQLRRYQKLEAVRRLAGGVAHNINNLLTIIIGYSQIMAESLDEADLRKRYSDEISNAAERAAHITSQLLTFSRHGVVAPRVLDLNAVVAGCERSLTEVLGEGITFTRLLRPEAGKIRAGAGQVEQVLKNLALNAREAMPEGGSFTIETSRVQLDEDYALLHPGIKPGEFALLSVTDTGRGMDPETRSHLFEPYFTTKGIGKGTGLAVVYGIVRQCGGDLAIFSEPGAGTTVGLFFPKVEELPQDPAQGVAPASGQKLLLVEDQPEVLAAIREVLESQGHKVLAAGGAEEALQIWEQESHDIRALIADILLPRIGGPELAEILLARRPDLRVLYISGYDEDVFAGSSTASRALFLRKPFTPDALRLKIHELLHSDSPSTSR